jgi:hypothetical protein
MSHTSTKEPAGVHTTRQLLDELDALMERMLAVPVADGADADQRPDEAESIPAVAATLTMIEPAAEPGTASDAYVSIHADEANEPSADQAPSFDDRPVGNRLFDDQPPDYRTAGEQFEASDALSSHAAASLIDSPPPSVVEVIVPAPQPLAPLPGRLRPSRSPGYQLLLWVNRGYDRVTFLLGRRGRWLRTRIFRLGLGLAGAALFAAALAWLASDWLGWTN